jgi:hypothetical protein
VTTIDTVTDEVPNSASDAAVLVDTLDEEAVQGPPPPTKGQLKKMAKQAKLVSRDAGDILQSITSDEIIPVPHNISWDQDPELLCCYNWQDAEDTNTIFVPGGPPKWTPPSLPHTLKPDSGFSYSDYNYVRQPRDPYSPLFHALSIMKPDYCFNDVDVIADRNNLRVLLDFVSGKANGPFRLDLFVTLNTLMLVRNGENFWKNQDASGVGFGGNFEKAFTRPGEGLEDATSHYRAIRYQMGSLNVVCRFEADAYYDGASDELTSDEVAVVSGGLAEKPRFNFRAPTRVLQKGHIVPTAQMAELKTTTYKGDHTSGVKCMDQLWFGRTSHLITGHYQSGTGTIEERRIKIEDATSKIKKWEESQQNNLRKLAGLLTQLRTVVKQERGPIRAAVLVREERSGPVVIRSKEMRFPIVKREFFERYWQLRPAYTGPPQFGGGRGQEFGRGGAPSYQRGGASAYQRGGATGFQRGGASGYPRGGALGYPRGGQGYQRRGTQGCADGGAKGYGQTAPEYERGNSHNYQRGRAPIHGREDHSSPHFRGRDHGHGPTGRGN